jgi:hypothetical protein
MILLFFLIKDRYISFSKDGIFYDSFQVMNDLYVLEMNNQIININNKMIKSSRENETLI